MASIVVAIAQADAPAFRELVATHHLVEIVKVSTLAKAEHPILFTLDAGIGNSINYYYLGQAWGAVLLAKGETPPC